MRRLAAHADVLCENFRPGTLERWGLGPADLDPRLVVVRISTFGQDGPYAPRPGLDRMGIGYGGLLHLTGYADRPPVRPGVTTSDYLTAVFAAQAPLDNYPTADGRYVCLVAGSDANFARLCRAMSRPDLLADPRFASLTDRAAHAGEINGISAACSASPRPSSTAWRPTG